MPFSIKHGSRYLGGFLGDKNLEKTWIEDKVEAWEESVEALSSVSSLSPQCAFAGLQNAMQCEWAFLQRVVPGISGFFEGVEIAVSGNFFTSFFGDQITSTTRSW